jgi:hypothetical protein
MKGYLLEKQRQVSVFVSASFSCSDMLEKIEYDSSLFGGCFGDKCKEI